jgi:hypothetical protein
MGQDAMTNANSVPEGLQSAAIVCEHVASGAKIIRIAERAPPEDPADSGWQFCCGDEEEDWQHAQVWSLGEVLQLEPSLSQFVDLPADTTLFRAELDGQWERAAE